MRFSEATSKGDEGRGCEGGENLGSPPRVAAPSKLKSAQVQSRKQLKTDHGRDESALGSQIGFRRPMNQFEILNSYYGIRGGSPSKSKSNLRAERESSEGLSHTQLKSNYTRKQSPLVSINRYAAGADAPEDGVGTAKTICISNVNDASNFRKKVQ